MRIARNNFRAAFAALLLVAFFIPAYNGISGFYLLRTVVPKNAADPELSVIDLAVVVVPLVLLLAAALLVLLRSVSKKAISGYLLGVPFGFLAFLTGLIFLDVSKQHDSVDLFSFLSEMNSGFFLAGASSVLLLLSYSRHESLKNRALKDYR